MTEGSEARPRFGRTAVAVVALVAAVLVSGGAARSYGAPFEAETASSPAPSRVGIVVRERSPASPLAERLVRRLGGKVTRKLPIVDGFAADVPKGALASLGRAPVVAALWRDGRV